MKRVQRIQKVGNSAAVILPKSWLEEEKLKPGSNVVIEARSGRLIVYPPLEDREIRVDRKFLQELRGFGRRHRRILERLAE